MMIYVVNYADEKYRKQQRYNTHTAYSKGKCDKVFEYTPNDIDKEYKEKHKKILSYERGAGLWLWKPYIILDALSKIKNGEYLLYCDSGAFFVNKIQYLVDTLEKYGQYILTFEIPLLAREFTKSETFYLMNVDDYTMNQRLGGYILVKKCPEALQFIKEWQFYMEDERILSPEKQLSDIKEFEGFYQHREDQSVFSLLCFRHNLPAFRDPSQFGDRPWMYANCKYSYNPKSYDNSPYPKIIVSNRSIAPLKFKIKEKLQTILNHLGIYTKNYFFWKNHIYIK